MVTAAAHTVGMQVANDLMNVAIKKQEIESDLTGLNGFLFLGGIHSDFLGMLTVCLLAHNSSMLRFFFFFFTLFRVAHGHS